MDSVNSLFADDDRSLRRNRLDKQCDVGSLRTEPNKSILAKLKATRADHLLNLSSIE